MKHPARGGGRWVEVAPPRLVTWAESFTERHPAVTVAVTGPDVVTFAAGDGAAAECHVPFPPLPAGLTAAAAGRGPAVDRGPAAGGGPAPGGEPAPGSEPARGGGPAPESGPAAVAGLIVRHVEAPRTVAVLLVRLGGYAAGVFTGSPPRLAASKVGARLVHGRSAAGGRSQHRFARRREKQAAEALSAAAGTAAAVFGSFGGELDAVVLGGDRRAIAALRGDPRLSRYFELASDRFLAVPDPRLAVLRDTPRLFRAIRIRLLGPA